MLRGFKPVALGVTIVLAIGACASSGRGGGPAVPAPQEVAGGGGAADILHRAAEARGDKTLASFGGVYQEAQRGRLAGAVTALTACSSRNPRSPSTRRSRRRSNRATSSGTSSTSATTSGWTAMPPARGIDYTLDQAGRDPRQIRHEVSRRRHHVRCRPRLQHPEDRRRGPGGLARLLRHDQDPWQARPLGVLHGRVLSSR